jgi:hypothetical protein
LIPGFGTYIKDEVPNVPLKAISLVQLANRLARLAISASVDGLTGGAQL